MAPVTEAVTTQPATPRPAGTEVTAASVDVQKALDALAPFGSILSIKLYRLTIEHTPTVPVIPCLDHEAMLHQVIAPHAAAYLQEAGSGELHELVSIPEERRIEVDTISTWEEHSLDSHRRLLAYLTSHFPGYRLLVQRPSQWRGERRVAEAFRAQVSLRDVLQDEDLEGVKANVERLQTVGALMEKQSRVASWGVRTLTGPVLAAAGVVAFLVLGSLTIRLGESSVAALRYAVVGVLGAGFLYYGLKAVQLTEMANRVWKRGAEYSLILAERRRLARGAP